MTEEAVDLVADDSYTPPKPAAAAVFESETVPPGAVMEHPANPRKDLGDLTELEESIREVGIVQAPVVLPAARVAAAWPQHAEEITTAGAEWVVLVGARRRAAAVNVGVGDEAYRLPIAIRRDGIADDPLAQLDVMTAENIARKPLSPVEEARSFDAQVRAGRSQRTIAARMGCSQGQVSKRLKLLRLPSSLLTAVETGTMEIGDGMALVDAAYAATEEITDDGERVKQAKFLMLTAGKLREERGYGNPAGLVREVQQELDRRAAREAAQQRLEQEQVPVIESAHKKFGSNYYTHWLRTDSAVEKARQAGTLVAEISAAGGVSYYSTAKPKRQDNRTDREEAELALRRAKEKAKQARDEACAALVAAAPKIASGGVQAMFVDTILLTVNSDPAKLAKRWLRAAGVIGEQDAQLSPYQLGRELRGRPWPVRATTAYALSLAAREMRIRWEYHNWDATDADFLAVLVEQAGYEPAPHEQAKLNGVAAAQQGDDEASAVLIFDEDDACCWVLLLDGEQEPVAYAEDLVEAGDVDAAQAWATAWLAGEVEHPVTGWQQQGQAHRYAAVFSAPVAATGGDGVIHQDGDVLHCCGCGAEVDIHADGDPLKAVVRFVDQHDGCTLPEAHRLRFAPDGQLWQLLGDERVLADHDGLDPHDIAAAQAWAVEVLADDGIAVTGWQPEPEADQATYLATRAAAA